mgnify:CR=1 FL=1
MPHKLKFNSDAVCRLPECSVWRRMRAYCKGDFCMAENCSQIDMVDLRYYLNNVSALTEHNSYDEVLILYGISNMCEANDLAILQ